MIIDNSLRFSKAQALTATAASTDHLDLGADIDIGPGTPLWLVVVSRAAPGGTSPTIAIAIQTDDNASFSSATALFTSATLAGAAFSLGTILAMPFPLTNERYVRAHYTLGGTDPTFSVDTFLTPYEPTNWKAMPDALGAW